MPRPRRILVGGAVAIGLVAGALGIAWLVAARLLGPPSWYAPSATTDAVAGSLGERVEYRLVEELQRVRPPAERWTVRVTDEQANAWLAARLPAWWRTETGEPWPEDLRPPQLRSAGGELTVVMGAELPGLEAGLVAVVRPAGQPVVHPASGFARVGLAFDELRVGRTGTSALAASDLVIDAAGVAGEDAERVRGMLADPAAALDRVIDEAAAGARGGDDEDVAGVPIRLADGRRVRLESIGLESGAMTFRFAAAGPEPKPEPETERAAPGR